MSEPATLLDQEPANDNQDWRAGLPDDLKDLATHKDIKSLEDLVRSHDNVQRMVGDSIRRPSSDASEADWNKFWDKFADIPGVARVPNDPEGDWSDVLRKMGKPETPADYGVKDEKVAAIMHEQGLSKRQATALYDTVTAELNQRNEQEQLRVQQGVSQLREKWGDAYDRQLHNVRQVLGILDSKAGDDRFTKALTTTTVGQDPAVIEMLATVAGLLDEPKLETGNGGRFGFSKTPDQLRDRIGELERTDAYKAGDKQILDELSRLYSQLHPDD